jgi:nucleolar protein 4
LGSVQAILASEKQETKVGERIVAVDWALPKDAFIQQRDKEQKKSEKVESSVGKESQSAVDSDHESENESDNSNVSESEDEDEEDEAADDSESDEEMTDVVEKQRFDDVNERRTVFVRNLPYSISSQEIRSTFEQFGTVKSVSMTKTTLANGDIAFKGTAFVEFSSAEEAENAIQKSAIPTDAIPEKLRKKKSDALKSIALEGVGGLWIQNRLINVSLAISRAQAHELADQSSDLNKRNMNLAQEGLILENSSAAKDVSKSDLERRAKLWKETKTKLTLPNYTVSKVRLSVHNLPLKFTESELSELFSKSVNGKEFRIVQTKIIRDKLRIDNDTGLGRSKRYGFVEFSSHDDALAALRALNNNPNVWGKSSRPIVSFAIDDSRKLHIRELKRQASKRKHKMVQEEDSSSSNKKRKSVNLAWTKEHPNAKSNLKKSKKSKASLF